MGKFRIFILALAITTWGGGFRTLNAVELSKICTASTSACIIQTNYQDIANNAPFSTEQIKVMGATISTFTNHSTITSTSTDSQTFYLDNDNNSGKINHLINTGIISGGISIYGTANMTITNYGTMRGVWTRYKELIITLNNLGIIKTNQGTYVNTAGNNAAHFALENSQAKVAIQNYLMILNESPSDFNNFKGYTDKTNNKNSHLIIFYNAHTPSAQNVYFKDGNSKLILDFGSDFELGKEYTISKLVTDRSGTSVSALNVDFGRLTTRSDLFYLTQSGGNFIAHLVDAKMAGYGIIGSLYKANVRTMNNFTTMSNAMIYPRKHNLVILRERSDRRISNIRDSALDSANYLKSYESFAYRNEAQNRRIQRQNKRNYNRKSQNQTQNLKESQRNPQTQRFSQNQTQNPHDYYFILTPFINHNLFFESARYNLRGFDYGFLTAFSAKVAESNSLGAHFIISYGSLGDKKDKDLSIKSLNLNLGLNYKLDLIWDMYLKARGDFYYFLNQAKTLTMIEAIKPNNLGFGASVVFGKDFDFKSGGVLGIEAGLDYKALQSSTISLHDNIYQKALYHLLYADLGLNYNKYFGNFGLNAGLGIKGNITANKLAISQIRISNLNRNVDMVLDNDMFLGYANLGASYVLNHKNFDMEFSLAYYGNFGDRVISNAGGFEWRVWW